MSRVLTEGFEDGTGRACSINLPVILSDHKRSGVFAGASLATFILPTALAEFYVRIGYYPTGTQAEGIILWRSGETLLGQLIITGQKLQLKSAAGGVLFTGETTLNHNTWYLIELHAIIGNSGTIEIRLEGIPEGSYSGDTQPGTETTVDRLDLGQANTRFDDIAINDTTGATDNGWCGDGHVIALMPNANGDVSQLVGSDGNSTDNYALVGETAPNTTDYVESDTVNEYDLYHLAACGLTDVTIKRVWAQAQALNTVAVGDKIALGIKPNGGSEAWGSDQVLYTSYYQFKGDVHTVNPATSAAWSVADLDALQLGVKVR